MIASLTRAFDSASEICVPRKPLEPCTMSLWRSSTSSLFIASSLLISGPCFAAVSAADFDKDDTGTLNNRERRAYFIHLSSEVHQKVDEDKDGDISAAEMSTFLAKV